MGRLALSLLVVAVATLLGLVALTSNWVRSEALDTAAWVETSGELLADEPIRREVAAQIADQTQVPGGPAAEAAIAQALALPEVEPLWREANERTHSLLVAVVDESPAAGSLGTDGAGEPLLLDLTPIADRLGADLDLPPGALGDEIALEVVSANELEALRGAGDLLDAVAIATLVAALIGYGFAFAIAPPGRRRLAALAISGSLVAIGALTLLVRGAGADSAIEELGASADTRAAAERAWLIGTDGLADLATVLVVLGSLGIAAAIVVALLSRSHERERANP